MYDGVVPAGSKLERVGVLRTAHSQRNNSRRYVSKKPASRAKTAHKKPASAQQGPARSNAKCTLGVIQLSFRVTHSWKNQDTSWMTPRGRTRRCALVSGKTLAVVPFRLSGLSHVNRRTLVSSGMRTRSHGFKTQ